MPWRIKNNGWVRAAALALILGAACAPPPAVRDRLLPPRPVQALVFTRLIGGPGTGPGMFTAPTGCAADPQGFLYVADTGNDRIQKFNPDGRYLAEAGGFGWDNGQFSRPTGVYARSGIDVWVVDGGNERVQQFDTRLNFIRTFSLQEYLGNETDFGVLYGIGFSPGGDILISDPDNEAIYRFNPFGELSTTIGTYGYGEGYVAGPADLVFDRDGTLYVCDTGRNRIAVFDQFGTYRTAFGEGTLAAPEGVAVDGSGNCYVADTGHDRVAVFDRNGSLTVSVGGHGKGAGSFDAPSGVTVSADGRLYVADRGNNRVQVFGIRYDGNDGGR